jgi:hypothetical protein
VGETILHNPDSDQTSGEKIEWERLTKEKGIIVCCRPQKMIKHKNNS